MFFRNLSRVVHPKLLPRGTSTAVTLRTLRTRQNARAIPLQHSIPSTNKAAVSHLTNLDPVKEPTPSVTSELAQAEPELSHNVDLSTFLYYKIHPPHKVPNGWHNDPIHLEPFLDWVPDIRDELDSEAQALVPILVSSGEVTNRRWFLFSTPEAFYHYHWYAGLWKFVGVGDITTVLESIGKGRLWNANPMEWKYIREKDREMDDDEEMDACMDLHAKLETEDDTLSHDDTEPISSTNATPTTEPSNPDPLVLAIPQLPENKDIPSFLYHKIAPPLTVPRGWSNDPVHLEGFLDSDLVDTHGFEFQNETTTPILAEVDTSHGTIHAKGSGLHDHKPLKDYQLYLFKTTNKFYLGCEKCCSVNRIICYDDLEEILDVIEDDGVDGLKTFRVAEDLAHL